MARSKIVRNQSRFMVKSLSLLRLLASAGLAVTAEAQITVEGVRFVDRALSGEIVIGNHRGVVSVIDYDNDEFMDLVVGADRS